MCKMMITRKEGMDRVIFIVGLQCCIIKHAALLSYYYVDSFCLDTSQQVKEDHLKLIMNMNHT